MSSYFEHALFDALADLGSENRQLVLCYLQKVYGIRIDGQGFFHPIEVEAALRELFGAAAKFLISRYHLELEKYYASIHV